MSEYKRTKESEIKVLYDYDTALSLKEMRKEKDSIKITSGMDTETKARLQKRKSLLINEIDKLKEYFNG